MVQLLILLSFAGLAILYWLSSGRGNTVYTVEYSNPGKAGQVAGSFISPETGETVIVLNKQNESFQSAINRVKRRHGL
jgi:ribosomal protein S4E